MSPHDKMVVQESIEGICAACEKAKDQIVSVTVRWVRLENGGQRPEITLTFK